MTRLVLKLLLKASLPLALLVGTMSYGVYLRGGDPLALLRTVGSGLGGDMAARGHALASRAGDGARDAGAMLSRADDRGQGGLTEVWTWRDADGVTHFSSAEPVGAAARTVSVDPRTNVLAPLPPPPVSDERHERGIDAEPAAARPGASADAAAGASDPRDDAMPGVAGLLRGGGGPDVSPEQAERLLRLLQGRPTD